MKKDLLVLESDKEYARNRIAELDDEIIALGPEFRNAFTQTSETWHDNAPFEAVRDRQAMLAAERHQLKQVLLNSLPSIPRQIKTRVGIGSIVTLKNSKNNKLVKYFIAGDWTPHAGQKRHNATIISRNSPLAIKVIGKKIGDRIVFNNEMVIESLDW